MTTDERFKTDVRFQRPKKSQNKLKIQPRLKKQFTEIILDQNQSLDRKVDAYGRKINSQKIGKGMKKVIERENDIKRYFDLEEEELNHEKVESDLVEEKLVEEKEENSSDEEVILLDKNNQNGFTIDEILKPAPIASEYSTRLALVHFPWDLISAPQLYKLMTGFLEQQKNGSGTLKMVSIYVSEFGRERIQYELQNGPPKEIFKDSKNEGPEEESFSDNEESYFEDDEQENDSEQEDSEIRSEDESKADIGDLFENNEEETFDLNELRKYQLQRLNYYYAILEFDSVQTAKFIYELCDGTELEASTVRFDLRFVPETETFSSDDLADSFDGKQRQLNESSPHYTHQSNINKNSIEIPKQKLSHPLSLNHSKVKLSWEAEEREELKRKFTKEDLKNMDFDIYLASEHSDLEDSETEGPLDPEAYRKLLLGGGDNEDEEEEDAAQEIEIKFVPGWSEKSASLSKKVQEKQEEELLAGETVFEKYLREKREKKREKRRTKKQQEEEMANDEKENDFFIEETSTKQSKTKKSHKKEVKPESDIENEDDLLLLPKSASQQDLDQELSLEEVEAPLKDSRFKALFEDASFSIDPQNSKFKNTETMKQIMKEKRKRSSRFEEIDSIEKQSINQTSADSDWKMIAARLQKKQKK